MRITTRLEFDAAHRITQHGGKCKNLHGHRYAVEVTVSGELDEQGMVIDFGTLRQKLKGHVIDYWDHAFIGYKGDKWFSPSTLKSRGMKVIEMSMEPTAEAIAQRFLKDARGLFPGVKVERVRVYETPNCWADAT